MRKVEVTYEVYTFPELSDKAKEKVKQWYLNDQDPDVFSDDCDDELASLFPNSELKVEYSLSYCQGDGLNIYGELTPLDVLERIEKNSSGKLYEGSFSKEEIEILKCYCRGYDFDVIVLPRNIRYGYCMADRIMFADEWIGEIKFYNGRCDIEELIKRFEKFVKDLFKSLAGKYEERGYNYFYEIEESDLAEICETNEYEFLEDGTLFP